MSMKMIGSDDKNYTPREYRNKINKEIVVRENEDILIGIKKMSIRDWKKYLPPKTRCSKGVAGRD